MTGDWSFLAAAVGVCSVEKGPTRVYQGLVGQLDPGPGRFCLGKSDFHRIHIFMFEIHRLSKSIDGRRLFGPISFHLAPGEILFVVGPSGTGKTLLLRLLSCLDVLPTGSELLLHGKTPSQHGLPHWRRQCIYCPQSSNLLMPGTPHELFGKVTSYRSLHGQTEDLLDLPHLVTTLGLEPSVLSQQWCKLSGGQSQRISLAIAVALRPSVLLLDEPSSALDQASTLLLEKILKESRYALIWVSHDPGQPGRVGGRVLQLATGEINDVSVASGCE